MPQSRLRQLLKFIRVFGFMGGLRLWCALVMQMRSRSKILELRVPGFAAPIRLRRADLPIFWQILVMQENDFHALPQARWVQDAYASILAEGNRPVIVDCGGHVGLSAVWFASRFPDAIVYSIEPDESNFTLLSQNTGAYANIVPLRGGVWSRSCHLEISNPGSGSASFRLREVFDPTPLEQANLLRAYTVGEVIRREEDHRALLVKIDVEGAEKEIFQDPPEWLQSVVMVIIELHDWLLPGQGTSRNFLRRIAEQDFDVVLRGENLLAFHAPNLSGSTGPLLQASRVAG